MSLPMLDVPGWCEKQAPECDRRRAGAIEHGSREARLQEVRLTATPGNDIVDLEGDADSEKKRQRDDVGEIQLQPDHHADLQGDNDGNKQGHEGQCNISPTAQCNKQDQRNRDD